MKKIAIYGKGGIGKSTIACNLSVLLAKSGKKVMQIGCDPKADSTQLLLGGKKIRTILEIIREKGNNAPLDEMVHIGEEGVLCVEAGGPVPGLGCAGRGIIAALEALKDKSAYDIYKPDILIYDVLGDVVCGGFSMPMRKGYADKVYVVTSGEKMSRYAAGNICMAVENFKDRGYASLGGIIMQKKNIEDEDELVAQLARDFDTEIVGRINRSEEIIKADRLSCTVVNSFPDSEAVKELSNLANVISLP